MNNSERAPEGIYFDKPNDRKRTLTWILILLFIIVPCGLGFAAFLLPAQVTVVYVPGTDYDIVNGNLAGEFGSVVNANQTVVHSEMVKANLLPEADPLSSQMEYFVYWEQYTGFTWHMSESDGFMPMLLPGILPGQDGQGNNGTGWCLHRVTTLFLQIV